MTHSEGRTVVRVSSSPSSPFLIFLSVAGGSESGGASRFTADEWASVPSDPRLALLQTQQVHVHLSSRTFTGGRDRRPSQSRGVRKESILFCTRRMYSAH